MRVRKTYLVAAALVAATVATAPASARSPAFEQCVASGVRWCNYIVGSQTNPYWALCYQQVVANCEEAYPNG